MEVRADSLAGRQRELCVLSDVVRSAQAGAGGAVFVVGEPGIGKSRLLAELRTVAEQHDVRILRGRSSAIAPTVLYRPLTEALTALFRAGGTPPDGRRLGPYRAVLGRVVPDWQDDRSVPDTSPVVLAEAILRLLGIAGENGGCLLMLEDLHQADPETLAVVEYLIDNIESQPVALVGTSRADDGHSMQLARAARQRKTCDVLELGPLDRNATTILISSCLDTGPGDVPAELVDRMYTASGGIPLLVEELLEPMLGDGTLVDVDGTWRVTSELRPTMTSTLMMTLSDRVNQIGPEALELLAVAALLGQRFPVDVLQRAMDGDHGELTKQLYAATSAQLIVADDGGLDWYSFRYPLIADAVLAQLTPENRVRLARRAADGIEAVHPELEGEWCRLAATLRTEVGDRVGAARLLLTAGRRVFTGGAAESAALLLEQGLELVAGPEEAELRTDILDALIPALGEKGAFDRAFQLRAILDELHDRPALGRRLVELHSKMATVALHAGHWQLGIEQVERARAVLGSHATATESAPIDVVAAHLAMSAPSLNSARLAENLVSKAAPAAEQANLMSVACQAWELRGVLTQERDPAEAEAHFIRAQRLAERHRLPIERISALIRLGGNQWLLTGETTALKRASREAGRLGGVLLGYSADAALALDLVFSGDFEKARRQLDQCWSAVSRFKLKPLACYVLMVRATLAAHQGDRRQMQRELLTFTKWGGEQSPEVVLVHGLARTFCALLEDNVPRATRELTTMIAKRRRHSATFHLAGQSGLYQLLLALTGDLTWTQYHEVASTASGQMRWNQTFVLLTKAVLLGRDGRVDDTAEVIAAAAAAGRIYPVAWHLGLRLVAPAARADGWGEPITWLGEAEEFFHGMSANGVAGACRSLLSRFGAPVQPRRRDFDRVPSHLRKLGITVREYEVLELLARRLSNKELADELHISPRTVEKHVANLIVKTGHPNRTALNRLAEDLTTVDEQPA